MSAPPGAPAPHPSPAQAAYTPTSARRAPAHPRGPSRLFGIYEECIQRTGQKAQPAGPNKQGPAEAGAGVQGWCCAPKPTPNAALGSPTESQWACCLVRKTWAMRPSGRGDSRGLLLGPLGLCSGGEGLPRSFPPAPQPEWSHRSSGDQSLARRENWPPLTSCLLCSGCCPDPAALTAAWGRGLTAEKAAARADH